MRIPIRMIGIATSVFWVFLIVFSVSALYSMKDIQVDFGEPQSSLTSDDEMLFSLPIAIVNNGYYSIGRFNVSTVIVGRQNQTITHGSTFVPIIGKGEVANVTHQMRINLNSLLSTYQNLVFNDMELQVNATASMTAAEIIPIQVSSNFFVPWGAPLCNFTVGPPEITVVAEPNSTPRCRAVIPLSFENHAIFDLTGTVHLHMYNGTNAFISEGQVAADVTQNSVYHGSLELNFPASSASRTGYFEVYFATSLFNSGPLVVPYGT